MPRLAMTCIQLSAPHPSHPGASSRNKPRPLRQTSEARRLFHRRAGWLPNTEARGPMTENLLEDRKRLVL